MRRPARTYLFLKRALDLICSLVLLALLSPALAVLWALVRLKLGSPAIFRQERAGLGGRAFQVYKFRTMTDQRDASGALLPDEQRLTAFGRALRRASLDELPQFWNVLEGSMSLVGPRPLYMRYIPRYSQDQRRRLEAKPGITGLAQINGRNAISWDEKLAWDVAYVEKASLGLDLRILLGTLAKVVRSEGISQAGHATAEEFQGPQNGEERHG